MLIEDGKKKRAFVLNIKYVVNSIIYIVKVNIELLKNCY